MFKGIIEKKVMKVIRGRIASAEKEYEEGVAHLEKRLEDAKIDLADKLVSDILGKVL